MNKYIINSSTLAEIGNTIRNKVGISEAIPVPEIPKHIENVFESGKKSMVDQSKIIDANTSGTYIQLDDVSEIPHDIKLNLKSETITDFSNVNVTICEKNLLNADMLLNSCMEKNSAGTYTMTKESTEIRYSNRYPISIPAGTTYAFSFSVTENSTAKGLFLWLMYTDGTEAHRNILVGGDVGTFLDIFTVPKDVYQIRLYIAIREEIGVKIALKDLQLELNSTVTNYEPYNGKTATANVDGTVDGLTSLSPFMNITTNTAGVSIDATYHKSWGMQTERTRFYNDFQQGKINVSISFEWLSLDKQNTINIINALSDTAISQTLTLNLSAVNTVFETSKGLADGSTSTEWNELVATKPNWIISLA